MLKIMSGTFNILKFVQEFSKIEDILTGAAGRKSITDDQTNLRTRHFRHAPRWRVQSFSRFRELSGGLENCSSTPIDIERKEDCFAPTIETLA